MVKTAHALAILDKVSHAASQWKTVGKSLSISQHELDQFAGVFEHREAAAARNLVAKEF